jgi:hypothetical protein
MQNATTEVLTHPYPLARGERWQTSPAQAIPAKAIPAKAILAKLASQEGLGG